MPPLHTWSWFAVDLIALALGVMTLAHLFRQRQEPGARPLAWMVAAVAVWACLDVMMTGTGDPELAAALARIIYLPQVVLALGWLLFALEYTGQEDYRRDWAFILVCAVGAATVLLAAAGDTGGWLVSGGTFHGAGGRYGFIPDFGAWRPVHQGWSWGTVIFSTGVLALHVAQSPRHVNRLVFVLGGPLVAAASYGISGPLWRIPEWVGLQPLGLALAGAALGFGLLRVGERAVAPVARNVVVEEMEDAVVVLDRRGRIVDVNRSARDRLGLRLLGPVPVELGAAWTTVREQLGTPGMPVSERVDLAAEGGATATFEVSVTLLGPQGGRDRTVLVLRDITRQVTMEKELRTATMALHLLASTDDLTGLANRRHLVDRLKEEADRTRRYGRPFSLILLDLDHFKRVNDSYGHAVGDEVLRVTARAMESVCRDLDLPGRMGGEEFAVILPETDAPGARIVADRLRLEIARCLHRPEGHEPFQVTASFGVATLDPNSEGEVEALLQAADEAMYRAKDQGRNRVAMAR
ncbi:MAG TPA: diguanylate cyclase [Longimicrobiales bacterium]|nr:diguanylate cyclase [Longimicrobiales bacterium]